MSRFGCTEQNKLFKDAPDVACLCSEANLESVIASCMQSSCPKDPEVLGIGAFLDRFCLCKLMSTDAASLAFLIFD